MPTALITGCRGKVGKIAADKFQQAGWTVVGTDIGGPVNFDSPKPGDIKYVVADLTDSGSAFALVSFHKPDVVVHIAAIPEPYHHPNHVVFQNNLMATFNVIEACVRCGVKSLVNISSETVPGFFFPELPFAPPYCPVDEETPIKPQDPYALAKHFGEQLCDAAIRRAPTMGIVTIRPSWCQTRVNVEHNLGPYVRDTTGSLFQVGMWSYIWVEDLAEAMVLAARATCSAAPADSSLLSHFSGVPTAGSLSGQHQLVYIAAADNIGGRDLAAAVAKQYNGAVPVKPLTRPDASGISSEKARKVLGWHARTSWADVLDSNGALKPL